MAKQPIPVVTQGTIELESGQVVEFDSPKARAWLAEIEIVTDSESGREKEKGRSFRYESMHGHASFTARNQPIKGISYWYGSKKVAGEVHKHYVGKLENLTIAQLEEVAEKFTNPEPKAVDKKPRAVANRIPEAVKQESNSRIEALETQAREMREALEELRGKLRA